MRPIWRRGFCGPRSPITNGLAPVLGAQPPSGAPGHRISRRRIGINRLSGAPATDDRRLGTPMSERRRAGALVVPKARPPADRSLLQTPATGDHQSDSWRVLRFISEFVEGF